MPFSETLNNSDKVIGFVNSSQSWGGGEKWHFEAARDLHARGYKICFFCEPGSEIEARLQAQNIPTKALKISNLSFLNPLKMFRLAGLFRTTLIKTLILNSPADVKLAAPAARIAGIPNIIFRRGMPHPISPNFFNRWLFNDVVHKVIANSQSVADSLNTAQGGVVPASKLTIIENGMAFMDDPDIQPLDVQGDIRLILSTAGRMVPQKNQRFLIDVAAQLRAEGLDFLLLIAGSGKLKPELEAAVASLELRSCVKFTGFIDDMRSLLATTDIFIFPSLYEGSPNTLIEAAGYGVPVVASDIPPNREILPDNTVGRLAALGDTKAFCSAITELAVSQELRRRIASTAKARVRKRFDLENARNKLIAIL